jgi:hypothetical protein
MPRPESKGLSRKRLPKLRVRFCRCLDDMHWNENSKCEGWSPFDRGRGAAGVPFFYVQAMLGGHEVSLHQDVECEEM